MLKVNFVIYLNFKIYLNFFQLVLGHNGLNFLNVQKHVAQAAKLEHGHAMEVNVQENQLKHNIVIVVNAKLVKIWINVFFQFRTLLYFIKIYQL